PDTLSREQILPLGRQDYMPRLARFARTDMHRAGIGVIVLDRQPAELAISAARQQGARNQGPEILGAGIDQAPRLVVRQVPYTRRTNVIVGPHPLPSIGNGDPAVLMRMIKGGPERGQCSIAARLAAAPILIGRGLTRRTMRGGRGHPVLPMLDLAFGE